MFLGRLTDTNALDQGQKFKASAALSLGQFINTNLWDDALCYAYAAIEAGVKGRLVPLVAK